MIRLLILAPEYAGSGGGIMTFYQSLVPALVRNGCSVRIIEGSALNASERADPRLQDGFSVEMLERARLDKWWGLFSGLAGAPGLRRHLAAAWAMSEQASFGEESDIIEAADWGLLFVPPAIQARRPLLIRCHGSIGQIATHDPIAGEETQDRLAQLIERATMARAAAVSAYSCANAAFWERETGQRVEIIRPVYFADVAGAQPINPRGLVVGRVQRWKGPQVVCTALARLGARAPAIDWYGRDALWGKCASSGVAHLAAAFPGTWGTTLVHHPQIPASEVARRQASALFNLIPSTWDTFNFTAIEAMVSGRPAIVSTGAGASELIEDGANGFLFPANDADKLAATIERVMSETPARLAAIGKAAQETVRAVLDPERIAGETIAAYRTAIDRFTHHPPATAGTWLDGVCRPSPQPPQDSMAFLDHHPLREILAYAARRIGRRLRPQ